MATRAKMSGYLKKFIRSATPSFLICQRVVSHGSDRVKLGNQWLYAVDMASEVVAMGVVGLVDCRIEIGWSLAADNHIVGIGNILRRSSCFLTILNQAFIIGNTRERPAEAFFVHSD
jgi:hypothetical protein